MQDDRPHVRSALCPLRVLMSHRYEELAKKYPQITFLHVDIDEMKDDIPEAASLRSVPTFVFYKDGAKVAVFSGADAATLRAHVARLV